MARISNHSSEETKNNLKSTFIELYKDMPIEKITIGALTKKAKVNRGTFYYYYKDIYEILEEIEMDYLNHVDNIIPILISGMFNNNLQENFSTIINFYKEKKDILLLFLVYRPNTKIISITKNHAKSYAINTLDLDINNLSPAKILTLEYISNAQIGLITYWLQHEEMMNTKDLSELIVNINSKGPLHMLSLED